MNRLVLVINCGSSSVKFAVIDADTGTTYLTGIAEGLGGDNATLSHQTHPSHDKFTTPLDQGAHEFAISQVVGLLQSDNQLFNALVAVGHRVVHGGEYFSESTRINEKVLEEISSCNRLAPLHNPANIAGINAAQKVLPDIPHVAVFDTAFHQSIPPYAYLYPLPYFVYQSHGVRRYGFHGSSHAYVCAQAAHWLNKPLADCCLISAHLGNGCSITAVKNGQSVDTSMGMTPLEGLVMGTRCGDIDPSLHQYLASQMDLSLDEVTSLLNKKSGLLGLSGESNDMRKLAELAGNGNANAQLAIEVFCYRLAKYVGAYAVAVGRIDALIFTGGIGENAGFIRQKVVDWLGILNLSVDRDKNESVKTAVAEISAPDSLPVLVIKTNEEWVIAKDVAQFAQKGNC